MGNEKEEVSKGWEDYRNSVIDNKNKSQDDFEKYINILASGGIIVSLTFLDKIVEKGNVGCVIPYVIGLILLVVTLLSNLYSHYRSIVDSDIIIKEIDEKKYDDIFKNSEERNKIIRNLNTTSIWSLILGAVLILTFTSKNLFYMNDSKKTKHFKVKQETIVSDTSHGRTNPVPKPELKPKK